MHHTIKFLTGLAATLLSLNCHAGSFQEASQHLDTDGSLVAFMDFKGDGKEIGDQLNAIYADILKATPEMMPIPIDFNQLFDSLGFGSFESIGISSKELGPGLHVNRSVGLFNGKPEGLFGLYQMEGAGPTKFEAAHLAPADAHVAGSGPVNLAPLAESYRTIMMQTMGPMGEKIVQSHMAMPILGTELTPESLIEELSGYWNIAYKIDLSNAEQPEFTAWACVKGGAGIVAKLKPLSESMPVVFKESNGTLTADFSALTKEAKMGLFLEARPNGDLVLYTDATWTDQSEGPRLVETPEYKDMTKDLPTEAIWYSYSAGIDLMDSFKSELSTDPMMGTYYDAIMKAYGLLLADFYKPTASAAYYEGDALVSVSYGSYSYKQAIMLVPSTIVGVYAGIGFSTYRAFQSLDQVSAVSQEKAVTNNLRQIASAADQYFLEEGKAEVTIEDLVGPGKYIRSLEPVAGESYEGMVIKTTDTEISVTLGNGEIIAIDF
ncbi:hypothetical protein DDZ13_10565 [Coraliomargarita sinensis]|uniref:Uncharacterized protein n=1 Tax=Coraliomargarita sinensis TaxID=2174842 RepID=A0A317ZIX7_9BACT|nr:hypothetical protein [Coraliomargarita sinensis]PXA03729.1 hypothetical protein DDZ13_10565 [Coraliomargarita sinensis]